MKNYVVNFVAVKLTERAGLQKLGALFDFIATQPFNRDTFSALALF
jgi:hypothetical protein